MSGLERRSGYHLIRDGRESVPRPSALDGWVEGTTLNVGDPILMTYDHRDQLAVSFVLDGETYFMLENEMGLQQA